MARDEMGINWGQSGRGRLGKGRKGKTAERTTKYGFVEVDYYFYAAKTQKGNDSIVILKLWSKLGNEIDQNSKCPSDKSRYISLIS